MQEPNRAKACCCIYSESSPIGAVHCLIGISSRARVRDQPGRGAPLPQLPGQVVGVLDGLRCVVAAEPTAGRPVDDTSRVAFKENTHGRQARYYRARDLGTDVEP
jgi:hypothetical protein